MSQEITHPVFGYRISYRRVLEVQARLLGRYLAGEIPEYPSFTTRVARIPREGLAKNPGLHMGFSQKARTVWCGRGV